LLICFSVTAVLFSATTAEEHDSFCVACHTPPEETYYNRAQSALSDASAVDLSSVHYTETGGAFRCIDCHRGASTLADRAATLILGARDTFIFLAGNADPALEKRHSAAPQLISTACLYCHAEVAGVPGFNNHYHNKLAAVSEKPPDAVEIIESTVACSDCHYAHVSNEIARGQFFLDLEGVVYPACEQCHRELGSGPQKLRP
jgi:hypothetical protein